ncbi:3-phosphoshikimate 1-carboxyvinyltransferase [Aestuariimicrobium kwangyangense]|uniref:3-phosphoshikimate 1-carboxyvinyltransferase n=1 Tax=Aestuariimicrobium kwangyangense TaxID=396389 RepID=UPI00047DCE26|nr:3-phosphoshikimate 1-carboxyvinyltransferase [Aestuariimicrobium kwangyangense]
MSHVLPWSAPRAHGEIRAHVSVPGSKSETNRALLLAALAHGPSRLRGALDSRDSDLMRGALEAFGVDIQVSPDPREPWVVTPPAEFLQPEHAIDCGLAGTVMRFVPPLAAAAGGSTSFTGDEESFARPMKPMLDGLRQLGCSIDSDHLPLTVTAPAGGLAGPRVEIDSTGSSQFISALLLCAARFPHGVEVHHTGAQFPSIPPIQMSVAMLRDRGVDAQRIDDRTWRVLPGPVAALDTQIEPDLTGASVFLAAAAIVGGELTIEGWPRHTTQSGDLFRTVLEAFGCTTDLTPVGLTVRSSGDLQGADLDLRDGADLTPCAAAVALFATGQTTIRGVANIRGHETDRLAALRTEFTKLGAQVRETEDGLVIRGTGRHGAGLRAPDRFETYADHRMAHAGALAGLVVDGLVLSDVTCTNKTIRDFPGLWDGMLDHVGADA